MTTEGHYWTAQEYGLAAEGQFLAFAHSRNYEPEYFGGHHRSKDVVITVEGAISTVDVKAGFPWPGRGIGFMGRKTGIQIRADYLALVVHNRDESSRLYGDRLEFPEHDGIYLVPSQTVEELFTKGLNLSGNPSGLNVYAQGLDLHQFKVS
ncbi:hypothetical protein OOZ51_19145 [Arthrobacter sp. MI7-26]|uniref:hypothetical protein n=1 Tax=Arthrobacter sp. MI7-26 TaxID=2993653 RepID=UPI0022488B32|nr:hypothetical protein [Arthrobacter sp. MI7-26]MCX2749910.1 hypothetical protein [Arthrobacter sp. MI7-26]